MSMTYKTTIWMPVYVAETLAESLSLTLEEFGALMLLRLTYWRNQGPLPYDKGRLAMTCRMTAERFEQYETILREHFVIDGDKLRSENIDHRIEEANEHKEKASEWGKRAAAARYAKERAKSSQPSSQTENP